MTKYKVIAVDGPSGSGKGTICKELAKITGYFYVDSGVYYRAITYLVQKNNVNPEDIDSAVELGKSMTLVQENGNVICKIKKENVEEKPVDNGNAN